MSCWGLVPIKSRAECKGRLASWLGPAERLHLVREMAGRVLAALQAAKSVDYIAVVTPERDSLPTDLLILGDPGEGLNPALDAARRALVEQGATELVVLPADLPLVTVADVELLVERGRMRGFALATDLAYSGTNALFLGRPAEFRFRFGPDSRRWHVEEAARLGLYPEIVRSKGLEFDLDRREDLDYLRTNDDSVLYTLQLPPAGGACLPRTRFG